MRPARANSFQVAISKITRTKWTGGMVKVVKHLLCKYKAEFKPPVQKKKKKTFNLNMTKKTKDAATAVGGKRQ
jgi:hypothetical protein